LSDIRFSYLGKVALVTGAGQGLGKAVALAFARAGAFVALSDIEETNLKVVADEITAAGGQSQLFAADMGNSAEVVRLVGWAVKSFGSLDILVNNAGVVNRMDIFSLREEEWDRTMAVNLRGVWVCARECLKVMSRQGSGRVINVGSISGSLGGHEVSLDYAVSKAGVAVLTKRLATEMAPYGITVNSVAPHALDTPMTMGHGEEGKKRVLANVPLRRFGRPEEVAAAILFLASEEAGFITGQTLHINGGALMVS
jgi:3-oxoacyl-[acyl-carrier protein] reductase